MERKAVEVMSEVCRKLAFAKVEFAQLSKNDPETYFKFREIIHDCEEMMAVYCDCAPVRLVNGQIDEIMSNQES
jgi:hypothetical protein